MSKTEKQFHAVQFMREVRKELTEQFLKDKEQYLAFLKKALEDFKHRQKVKAG